MKLLCCHVEQFGTLSGYERCFSDGVNRICAPNGSGKTTLAAFCKAMLYGLPQTTRRAVQENDRKHYEPWQGGRYGGSLDFEARGRRLRVERFFAAQKKDDSFRLIDLDTGKELRNVQEPLGEALFGLDANSFERTAFLSEQETEVRYTDAIGAQISRSAEQSADADKAERAIQLLENRRKQYEPYRGEKGEIPRLREKAAQLFLTAAAQIPAKESITAIQQKEKAARTSLAELENARARLQAQLHQAAQVQTKNILQARYAEMQSALAEQEKRLQELENRYPNGFPEPEECAACAAQIARRDSLRELETPQTETSGSAELERLQKEKNQLQNGKTAGTAAAGVLLGAAVLLAVAGAILLPATAGILLLVSGGVLALAAGVWLAFSLHEKQHRTRRLQRVAETERLLLSRIQAEEQIAQRRQTRRRERETLDEQVHALCARFSIPEDGTEQRRWIEMAQDCREWNQLSIEWEKKRQAAANFAEENQLDTQEPAAMLPAATEDEAEMTARFDQLREELLRLEQERQKQKEILQCAEEAAGEQRRCEEKLQSCERERDCLDQAIAFLKKARENYSCRYLEQVNSRFADYAAQCFGKAPERFRIDTDFTLWLTGGGESRGVEWFSRGSRDLLSLCVRLAALDAMYRGERPFLILDDPFVHLDAENRRRAENMLEELGKRGQLLCFSCRN